MTVFGRALAIVVLLGVTCLGGKVIAAPSQASASAVPSAQAVVEEPVENGSPRASVSAYLGLCRSGNYEQAARYLDVPKARMSEGPRLAKRLQAVLDRHAWIEIETLSPNEKGRLDDGLPQAYEVVAKIPAGAGRTDSVRLFKRNLVTDEPSWVFSRTTVEHVDAWYGKLEQQWALEKLPPFMQRSGPKSILIWQWMMLPLFLLVAWLLGAVFSRIARKILAVFALRTPPTWDDAIVARLGGPLTMVFALMQFAFALPVLGLYAPALAFVTSLIRGGYYFAGFWVMSRLIDVWGTTVIESPWAAEHSAAKSLVPMGVRLGKIVVLVFAVVVLISSMGYPATSLIAGLGVGGLAVALAAQKTVENLFGAFTLGFDQPFRVGDFVKIEDFLGHVEAIGIRSTKIRTLDRTLITIPNGKLSEMRIETFAARDRIRLACHLGLVYGTTAEQMNRILSEIEYAIRAHPKAYSEGVVVKLKELGESALNVEIQAWFVTSDYAEFQGIRQAMLLEFMRIVEREKAAFAFPTRTVVLQQAPVA